MTYVSIFVTHIPEARSPSAEQKKRSLRSEYIALE